MIINVENKSKEKPRALWYDSTNNHFIHFISTWLVFPFLIHLCDSICLCKPGTLHSLVQTFLILLRAMPTG